MKPKFTSRRGVNYAIHWWPGRCWWDVWTPAWHKGRGRYVSIGLYVIALYRGY